MPEEHLGKKNGLIVNPEVMPTHSQKSELRTIMETVKESVKEVAKPFLDNQKCAIESQERSQKYAIDSQERIEIQRIELANFKIKLANSGLISEHKLIIKIILIIFILGAIGTGLLFKAEKPELAYGVITATLAGIFAYIAGRAGKKNTQDE